MVETSHIDIKTLAELAGVSLSRSGRNMKGVCPFHADKDPSFFIYPNNTFHCFGCGANGDPIDFVQRMYSCDFKDALKVLGISDNGTSEEIRAKIKKAKSDRIEKEALKEWKIGMIDEISMLLRNCRRIVGSIKTVDDMGRVGELYHFIASLEYHLELLQNVDSVPSSVKLELNTLY
jgi:hypothetical protein